MSCGRYFELHWRVAGEDDDAEWTATPPVPAGAGPPTVNLRRGEVVDLRVRWVDERCRPSPWRYVRGHTVEAVDTPPPRPVGLSVPDGDCLAWEVDRPGRRIAGFAVLHALGRTRDLSLFEPAAPHLVRPPFPLCSVPRGVRTLAVLTVDELGNASETAAFVEVDRGPLNDALPTVLWWGKEHTTGWPGERRNAEQDGLALVGVLDASGGYGPAGAGGYGPELGHEPYGPQDAVPYGGENEHAAIPYGPLGGGTPYGDEDWPDLVYSARVLVPPGGWSPGAVLTVDLGDARPGTRIETRPDDAPYGPPEGGDPLPYGPDTAAPYGDALDAPWTPFAGRLPLPGPGLHELRVTVPGGTTRPRLEEMTTWVSAP